MKKCVFLNNNFIEIVNNSVKKLKLICFYFIYFQVSELKSVDLIMEHVSFYHSPIIRLKENVVS